VLSPQVGEREEARLKQAATSRIDRAERLVKQVDPKTLGKEQHETFETVQSFLAKAREAMSAKDFQRAFTLADKAKVLAEELVKR
jgi:hypothetical protein